MWEWITFYTFLNFPTDGASPWIAGRGPQKWSREESDGTMPLLLESAVGTSFIFEGAQWLQTLLCFVILKWTTTSSRRAAFVKALLNRSLSCTHWRLSAPRLTQTQSAERFAVGRGAFGCWVPSFAMNPQPSTSSSGQGPQPQVSLNSMEMV
jgi:hypothetical protein